VSKVVVGKTVIEEYEMPADAADGDMALADRLLANILVRLWRKKQAARDALTSSPAHGSVSGEEAPVAHGGP